MKILLLHPLRAFGEKFAVCHNGVTVVLTKSIALLATARLNKLQEFVCYLIKAIFKIKCWGCSLLRAIHASGFH